MCVCGGGSQHPKTLRTRTEAVKRLRRSLQTQFPLTGDAIKSRLHVTACYSMLFLFSVTRDNRTLNDVCFHPPFLCIPKNLRGNIRHLGGKAEILQTSFHTWLMKKKKIKSEHFSKLCSSSPAADKTFSPVGTRRYSFLFTTQAGK